jgi:hypothetical protein
VVEYQAKYYNKRHTPKEYKVGDWVLLASKNITMPRPSKKLDHRFLGPFQIVSASLDHHVSSARIAKVRGLRIL